MGGNSGSFQFQARSSCLLGVAMSILRFENVSLQYPIYNNRTRSLRNQFLRFGTGGRIAQDASHITTVTALDAVNFELRDGDAVGLIGHNGAGKSTLLRVMAGIYVPNAGQVIREGKVATVFDIGAGMDPELTGYENIVRMAMLIGLSRKEAFDSIPEIAEFTELGDFLQLPVRTYSSGMTIRLMFAVATAVRPSILLVDEMFGTGDESFKKRARQRIRELIQQSDIFVLASHDMPTIKSLCNKIFFMEHGGIAQYETEEFFERNPRLLKQSLEEID